jgi:hypothetical protein
VTTGAGEAGRPATATVLFTDLVGSAGATEMGMTRVVANTKELADTAGVDLD